MSPMSTAMGAETSEAWSGLSRLQILLPRLSQRRGACRGERAKQADRRAVERRLLPADGGVGHLASLPAGQFQGLEHVRLLPAFAGADGLRVDPRRAERAVVICKVAHRRRVKTRVFALQRPAIERL